MLKEVSIGGVASYGTARQQLASCKEINFIFGTNGSGKTTISRVIADPTHYPTCTLSWTGGRELERLIYNSDFIGRNFSSNMPGIFTLGEESAETVTKIETSKKQRQRLEEDIRSRQAILDGGDGTGGEVAELPILRAELETKCWGIKGKHDDYFRDIFEGFRNSKARFCDKILVELEKNTAKVCSLDDLKARTLTVFQKGIERQATITAPNVDDLVALEAATILAKKVVGKEDVDVAALIKRLGNSDWVKQGRSFLEQSGAQCPFCQQILQSDLASSLNEYFDEIYTTDVAAIGRVQEAYATQSNVLITRLNEILTLESCYLDNVALRADIERVVRRIELNRQLIESKKKEPTAVVTLEGISPLTAAITAHLEAANISINKHNEMVENLVSEKAKLTAQVWKFLLEDSKEMLDTYIKAKNNLDKAVAGLMTAISQKKAELAAVNANITALERGITSVQPTVDEINRILSSFGFTGFMLATAGEKGNLYKIVRADGGDATKTLSEGEKTFITFLYFYHLIRGSVSESGMTADRVVVFDDPVSSLDSDVLFIVSSLIKLVLEEACEGTKQIKQVFILTHNIYFHKEVSFDPKRGKNCRAHETFWIVRKLSNYSVISGYDHNPIKTSYELLWTDVKNPERPNMTIKNTLRRILENYFKLLGNLDKDEIITMFDGKDKQICGSLFSWVNDGSHAVHDDLYISIDNSMVERYLDVFRKIFEKTLHISHYNMMMGIVPVTERPLQVMQSAT